MMLGTNHFSCSLSVFLFCCKVIPVYLSDFYSVLASEFVFSLTEQRSQPLCLTYSYQQDDDFLLGFTLLAGLSQLKYQKITFLPLHTLALHRSYIEDEYNLVGIGSVFQALIIYICKARYIHFHGITYYPFDFVLVIHMIFLKASFLKIPKSVLFSLLQFLSHIA